MEATIFYGNGFNRLSQGQPSWDDLLNEIASDKLDPNIPNTMKYEVIISQIPYSEHESFIKRIMHKYSHGITTSQAMETVIKERLSKRMASIPTNKYYQMLLNMQVSNYITTNYDNALIRDFKSSQVQKYRQETLYSIRRHYVFGDSQNIRTLWPIHGCYESPKSIMLGLDHYCGSIGKINDYVKGMSEIQGVRVKKIEDRLRDGNIASLSWIDLIFNTDVHIIGFGLPYEEVDIWWLLDRRMRLLRKYGSSLIRNKVYYYSTAASASGFPEDKRQCLLSYGVEIVEPRRYSKNFESQFDYLLKRMRQIIKDREKIMEK